MANAISGLMAVARIESAAMIGMGLAGLYTMTTQPFESRHVMHLVNAVSFSIVTCVHLHHLFGGAHAQPHLHLLQIGGQVLESEKVALITDGLIALLNIVGFLASRGGGVDCKRE